MSVRKRQWRTGKGAPKEAWVVDYADAKSTRRLKTFARKKDADRFAATARVEVHEGTHVADSASVTVAQAGELWIARAKSAALERVTIKSYQEQLSLHIAPFIGSRRLSQLSAPTVREFEDRLLVEGRSPSMVRRVMRSLGSIVADAQERGLVVRNVVRELRAQRRNGADRKAERRQKGKIKVGVDIPTRDEIRSIIESAKGRWRPLIITSVFTGLRASELRGLRWIDVDLDARTLHVRQRADRFNQIGPPKSAAGERSIPLPSIVVATLREWQSLCPDGEAGLVFPTGAGTVEGLGNIVNRGFKPAQIAAGVVSEGGTMRAKYPGLHSLRHFFASWCINQRADGGLELPPKVAQERLGHASIAMTLDVYGHLFPRGEDLAGLDTATRLLFAEPEESPR